MHAKKDWVCDCCGSRFGLKFLLKDHMLIHLPPSFACSICDRMFAQASTLKNHLLTHAGVLNQICKICNKKYSTRNSLKTHISLEHFSKIHCEVPDCAYKTGLKVNYKRHVKIMHSEMDRVFVGKLNKKIEELKADYEMLKYV